MNFRIKLKNIFNQNRIVKKIAKEDLSLKQKTFSGGFWVFFLRASRRFVDLIRTIILARLLSPGDFGVVALALFVVQILENFSTTGIEDALIQKKGSIKSYLDTAWTIQLLRALIISIILFFGAPFAGIFFQETKIIPFIRVLALAEIVKGFTHIKVIYFQKKLEFHKLFIYQLSGVVIELLVSIPLAFYLKSAWALILGLFSGHLIRCLISYFIFSYRPKFFIKKNQAKNLFGFGKYVLFQNIVVFLITQGDDAFVGKILGTTALGIYQLAYKFSNITATEFSHVISSVTLPAYAILQNDKKKLTRALTMTLHFTAIITIPISMVIFIFAKEITILFLGNHWIQAVPVMKILAIFGLIRSITSSFGPVYRATKNLKQPLLISFIQLLFLTIIIYPLTMKFSLMGVATGVTVSLILSLVLTSVVISRFLETSLRNLYSGFSIIILKSLLMTVIMSSINTIHLIQSNLLNFSVTLLSGCLFYCILNYKEFKKVLCQIQKK